VERNSGKIKTYRFERRYFLEKKKSTTTKHTKKTKKRKKTTKKVAAGSFCQKRFQKKKKERTIAVNRVWAVSASIHSGGAGGRAKENRTSAERRFWQIVITPRKPANRHRLTFLTPNADHDEAVGMKEVRV